ncbi:non-ribosomal peptide synthetase [Nonlabens dokdonensis]|uniref:Gramicidin S synthetase 2 n=1 Tax=Nonlabens dokdonensis (strain DSM 17205 / KCTC 12402 / DSW-6) TaxID=592029 RepID=L7W8Y3_NONDD|nr:non-ribosomal peptide synthetase [Nonlabens dokdonensis]AGC75288.1 gramicidin S synthetase 2 [Nonlabens dokdonensis DSW-6]
MKELLEKLQKEKIHISLDGENLKLKFEQSNLSDNLIKEIKENKKNLINYLRKNEFQKTRNQFIQNVSSTSSVYPLSSSQKRIWVLSQLEDGSIAYNVPNNILLEGYYNVNDFEKAINLTIERHEILRTVFIQNNDSEVNQKILSKEDFNFKLQYKDYRKDDNNKELAEKYIKEDSYLPFDLEKGPLIRTCLLQLSEDKFIFYFNFHHIIGDISSIKVFSKDVMNFYQTLQKGNTPVLSKLRIQYKDYAVWQTNQLTNGILQFDKAYWLDKLSGGLAILNLPSTKIRPSIMSYKGNSLETYISSETTKQLRGFCNENNASLFMGVLAVCKILLYRYTNEEDIIIGTPISGRENIDLENQIGFYVNTLVLRNQVDPKESFIDFFKKIKESTLEAYSYQSYPFDKLVRDLNLTRDISRNAIFDVMLTIENIFEEDTGHKLEEEKVNQISDKGFIMSKVDIDITFKEIGDYLLLNIDYNSDVYDRDVIQGFISHYKSLLSEVLTFPEKEVGTINYLTLGEQNKLLFEWNSTDVDYPRDKTIYEMFESQVENVPDNIALVYEDKELTYNELNERSNELARHIRSSYRERTGNDLKPDTLIALCLDRSLEMIIGILGVLKAGGAYVPIDPDYPQDRIDYILEDTEAALVLSQRGVFKDRSTSLPEDRVVYIDLIEGFYQKEQPSNLPRYSRPTDLAYVIYTSGTTGKPKGVMVDNDGVVNYLHSQYKFLKRPNKKRFYLLHSYAFDTSISCVFGALCFSNTLIITNTNNRLSSKIYKDYNIHIAYIPPALLVTMNNLEVLDTLIISGELADAKVLNISSDVDLINEYGPTEAIVGSSYYEMNKNSKINTIGRLINNKRAYVLDKFKQVVPIGVIGELYIGGAGLSRGYLNNPNLTEERFIENPFATDEDREKGYTRLYRTGDLVRWLSDGNLEYIGRNDDQVKIRGYRIELGEIEYALRSIEGITQSCVIAKGRETETGTIKYLVGYYVLDVSDVALSEESILESLSLALPDYMIPSSLVKMDSFPLTINGKLDKKGLPAPEFTVSDDLYVAPTTETEKVLCRIWEEVLGLDRVGITDDFFRIGGDSILSIQVSSRIRQIGLSCNVRDIFESRSISRLIVRIESKDLDDMVEQEQGILEGDFSLLPIQQWFLERTNANLLVSPNHWNQSFLVRTPELDVIKLGSILDVLVSHHDMLRVCYDFKDDSFELNQRYESEVLIPELKTLDVSLLSAEAIHLELTKWQSDFDLESGPLFRVGYLHGYEDGSARIYFALHHMLVDGVSWRILADDLKRLYLGDSLGQKGSSYRQWVSRIRNYAKDTPEEGFVLGI